MDLPSVLTVEALKDGAVFTVNRKDPDSFLSCQGHDKMSCRHKGLLVGKSDILPCFHGSDGGTDPDHPNHRSYCDLCLRFHSRLQKSVHAGYDSYRLVRHGCF